MSTKRLLLTAALILAILVAASNLEWVEAKPLPTRARYIFLFNTFILDNKAGIGWTSYSHTGMPVPTSALGVGAEMFNGYYDQTDVYYKMMKIAGFGSK